MQEKHNPLHTTEILDIWVSCGNTSTGLTGATRTALLTGEEHILVFVLHFTGHTIEKPTWIQSIKWNTSWR